MVAKISPRHRAAFIEALAETGNYWLAAEQVRVSRDWAYKLRRRNAAFDAACREALRRARERLSTDIEDRRWIPDRVRDDGKGDGRAGAATILQRGKGRRVQVKRARANQWTEETERRFLAALAGSCNVRLSAAEVGMSATSAYYRRRQDRGFERAWAQAIETGYARLEAALVESATCFFEGEEIPADNPIVKMSVAEAIQALNMNKFAVKGEGRRVGRMSQARAGGDRDRR